MANMFGGIQNPRLVVVTGAGSGIGRATALRFAETGATLLVSDIDEGTAKQTAMIIVDAGAKAHAHRLDVTDDDAWASYATEVRERFGVPDLLVNNAGLTVVGGFLEQSKQAWDKQLAVNFEGMVNGCRHFAPMMADARRGHIVNVSSLMAYTPLPLTPSYNVSKAAILMFSETLRGELASHGVGVSAVCPGLIATAIGQNADVQSNTGVDEYRVATAQQFFFDQLERFGPILGLGPEVAARGIARAVRYNIAVLPIRPESWVFYAASRISPAGWRLLCAQVTPRRMAALSQLVSSVIPDRVIDSLASTGSDSRVR